MTLQNEKVVVTFNSESKEIFGRDLTDTNNDPAFYNKSVRGINKAWQNLEKAFSDENLKDGLTTSGVMRVLEANGIKIHYYCMMD